MIPGVASYGSAVALSGVLLAPAGGGEEGRPHPFTEEAAERGLAYTPVLIEYHGDGLAFVDLDDDRDADVVLIGADDELLGLYENDGSGQFTDRTTASGIGPLPGFSGVAAADYDRDGDLDLYITCRWQPNALLRNDGDFQFTDVGLMAGVADLGFGTGAAWGDYDGDGWMDLYLTNRGAESRDVDTAPNRMYQNLGDGTFEELGVPMGLDLDPEGSFQASFFDFDRDGDADLYVSTLRGYCVPPNYDQGHLFENVNGALVDITETSGTAACNVDAMCVALGDFDNNRYQDIYITNIPIETGNVLLMNQGDGTFDQQEVEAQVGSFSTGWGSVFFDYDNDGFLDLYVCNNHVINDGKNRLYRHEGSWPCVDIAAEVGVEVTAESFAVAAADVDLDGDLDLLVGSAEEPIQLFINHEGESRRWARFDVVGEGASRYAIGANVDVRTGATWRLREVIAGSNYKSQNELALHFGLGDAVVMDQIDAVWPGGTSRTVTNLPTNQIWTLYPPDKLGDGDGDGDRDVDDVALFGGCLTGDVPGSLQPGCEMMDYEGDGDVDLFDFQLFLLEYSGPQEDCDGSGVFDIEQILLNPSLDGDGDGILDDCSVAPAVPFTEEAADRGVDFIAVEPVDPPVVADFGQGVALADLDDDGDPDLVALGRSDGVVGVFDNDGAGFFTERSATTGIPTVPNATGVVAGDYDRDGDLDLYVTQGFDWLFYPEMQTPNLLLRNDGGFQFTDMSVVAGVGDVGPGYGCTWGDYDRDGWLDLFVSNRFTANLLYRNLGDGTFEEVAGELGVDGGDQPTFQAAFFDFDQDGDADLYVANDKAPCDQHQNHLFENVGGTLVDITEASGTEGCLWSMCIAIGDFDNNRFDDLYVTNIVFGNALMMNQGDGTFTREEEEAGVASYALAWGSVFFDYDHDGVLDLYVCNSDLNPADNRLYRHDGLWPTVDVAADLGVDAPGESFAVASGDLEGDGDLDLVVLNRDQPLRLFINHEGENGAWARFDVIGEGADRYAIGSTVQVRTGETWQVRQLVAGSNYLSQNELVLHFGLDNASVMDEIEVMWPGGTTRALASMVGNRRWTLYPPDKLGDGDGDGDRDLQDFWTFAGCYTGDVPGSIEPGCEMMDYEGDGDVDLADFGLFLLEYEGPQLDCNGNRVVDLVEILDGTETDLDQNGVLDSCQSAGDLNGDGSVNVQDLVLVIVNWGRCGAGPCDGDTNGDGEVDVSDLVAVITGWSP